MGSWPSLEKKDDLNTNVFPEEIKYEKRTTSATSQAEYIKNCTSISTIQPSNLENYGLIPDLVITNILLFLPLGDLSRVYSTCRLFYHCGNSSHFWRMYFENTYSEEDIQRIKICYKPIVTSIDEDEESGKTNWKRQFYFQRYFNDEYYRKVYTSGNSTKFAPIRLKTIMIGISAIGKSSFVKRITRDVFYRYQESGMCAAFETNVFTNTQTNQCFQVELWDTAELGQERYRSFSPMYFRGTDIIFLCFDLTSQESFFQKKENIGFRSYLKEIKRTCFHSENIEEKNFPIVVLLGLKSDLLSYFEDSEIKKREEKRRDYINRVNHEEYLKKDEYVNRDDVYQFLKENEKYVHAYVENSSKDKRNIMLSVGVALDLVSKKLTKFGGMDEIYY